MGGKETGNKRGGGKFGVQEPIDDLYILNSRYKPTNLYVCPRQVSEQERQAFLEEEEKERVEAEERRVPGQDEGGEEGEEEGEEELEIE